MRLGALARRSCPEMLQRAQIIVDVLVLLRSDVAQTIGLANAWLR